ncbi:low molecular weight protein-tyrosine-phosphatase [Gulosibacter faecalis]|jgi:protein-tyrosine phosphatase|uniref:protein-tyrosine-phosphatase n=1 Tax=Gulosibacter faecalis TaxID=272240 RepID=A0ABW5UV85_9MICO|nr:low molecular weight protein-tyrosine-phosphatase [Gulosibacter faecalis]
MSAVERAEPAFRICFVCTGNICRSPMAEAISRDMAARDGYGDHLAFDSAGTGDWHVGEKADPRTLASLERAGYTAEGHRAKQFDPDWFERFDLIVTFDPSQERILKTWADTPEQRAIIRSLLSFSDLSDEYGDVPDPYYGSDDLFNEVRDLIEHACEQLLAQVEPVARAARETAIP